MKNGIITGGSSGLGKSTAQQVAQNLTGRLVVTGSTFTSATIAADQILAEASPNHDIQVYGLALDLASLESIHRFIDEVDLIFNGYSSIDVVSCNAGVQIISDLRYNSEGFEQTIAVNHFGHLRLLSLLWPLLRQPARIVITASGTHDRDNKLARIFGFKGGEFKSVQHWAEGIGDLSRSTVQQGLDRYANSKLANIMTAMELARRFDKTELEVFAYDPGFIPGTGLARDRNNIERFLWHTLLSWVFPLFPGASTPEKSGRKLAELLLDEYYSKRTGEYFDYRGRHPKICETASNPVKTSTMLDQSLSLLELTLPTSLGVSTN